MEDKDKPETKAVSLGRMSDEHFGVVNTPVYRASTILYPDLAALKANKQPYTYGRRGTPTTRSFEAAINALEGAARTVTVPSGLNANAVAILSVCGAGDHLLMVDSAYEPTKTFCETTLKRFGVETTYYAPTEDVAPLLKPNTKAVFCESPGSLTFEVQDIHAIAKAAHAKNVSVLMDNTWATPVFFQPLKHGVDLSIQAATKYVGGHADVMLGYVSANDSHAAQLHETHGNLGLYASGDDCFLALRGLRTLPIRMAAHAASALVVAAWLAGRPEVSEVRYPPLPGSPGHALWRRDYSGAAGLMGVVTQGWSEARAHAFLNRLNLFGLGYSWGGFESLITHETGQMALRQSPPALPGTLLRLHVGLEDPADLIADLDQAFSATADV